MKGLLESVRQVIEDDEKELMQTDAERMDNTTPEPKEDEEMASKGFEVTDEVLAKVREEVPEAEGVSDEQLRLGLQHEQEHEDVTGGDPMLTAKIAIAHLTEIPDYYTRLMAMEQEAKEQMTDAEEEGESLEHEAEETPAEEQAEQQAGEPVASESKAEEKKTDEKKADEAKAEEAKADEKKAEEAKTEEKPTEGKVPTDPANSAEGGEKELLEKVCEKCKVTPCTCQKEAPKAEEKK